MSFGIEAVLFPVFVQVGLTFVLLFWMASLRIGALQRREVTLADVALSRSAWPKRPRQVSNAYHNQFELPLLFYVLVILAMFTRKADTFFVVLAWMFVTVRLAHAAIHVSSNDVRLRFYAFAVGAAILLIMWIVFALRLLYAGL